METVRDQGRRALHAWERAHLENHSVGMSHRTVWTASIAMLCVNGHMTTAR